ncbi:hypothetical protein OS493_035348 [Desmophyllum pertusum]|uniref:Uncharacterized protein n=1 Tax=Desmophyllum pertusum TaxID=174260 RepID=A0A9X0CCS7_9CNID|nr:hypothetical protein OS493_035348 [Desmophyllum pertusum]
MKGPNAGLGGISLAGSCRVEGDAICSPLFDGHACICYVQELKGELFSVTSKSQLKSVSDKYNAKVPPPLTSQFTERVNKPEAVKSYKEREKREVTHLYPSAEEQDHLQSSTTTSEEPVRRQRKQAKCHKCGKPMKGHSASVCNTDNSTN